MNGHIDPERLIAWSEGTISDAGERLSIERHLGDCTVCALDRDALRGFEGEVARAGARAVLGTEPDLPPALAQRMEATSRALLRRDRSFLDAIPYLIAVAAGLLLWLGLSPRNEGAAVVAVVATRELPGQMRGPESRLHSVLVAPRRSGYPAVLALDAAGRARVLYPDPNPLLGDLVRNEQLDARMRARVPKDPSLDFELRANERQLLVLVRPKPWQPGDAERVAAEVPGGDRLGQWVTKLAGERVDAALCAVAAK